LIRGQTFGIEVDSSSGLYLAGEGMIPVGLDDRGGSVWAAAQLDQDLPGLSVAMARSPQARIFAWVRVHGLLPV